MNLSPESLLSVFGQYVQMAFSALPDGASIDDTERVAARRRSYRSGGDSHIRCPDRASQELRCRYSSWHGSSLRSRLTFLLRHHVSDYYLTVPMIGLAMLGGWGVAVAWRAGIPAARIGP